MDERNKEAGDTDKAGRRKTSAFKGKIPSLRKKRAKLTKEQSEEQDENDFKINIYSGERDILEKTKKPRQ